MDLTFCLLEKKTGVAAVLSLRNLLKEIDDTLPTVLSLLIFQ